MAHASIGLLLVFGVVLLPVYLFILAAFVGKPRKPKLALLMLGLPAGLMVLSISGFWLIGKVLSFLVVA